MVSWRGEEKKKRRARKRRSGGGTKGCGGKTRGGKEGRKGARGSERRRSKVKKEGRKERTVGSEQWLAHARISSNALARNAIGEPVWRQAPRRYDVTGPRFSTDRSTKAVRNSWMKTANSRNQLFRRSSRAPTSLSPFRDRHSISWDLRFVNDQLVSIDLTRFVANEMERTQCHTLRPVKSPQRLLLHRLAIRIWRIVSPRVLISKLYANVFCHAFVAEKTRKIGISLSYFIERWSACILFVLSYFRSLSFFLSFNSFLLIIQAKICLFFPPFFLNFFERERRNALIRFSCSLKCTRGGGTCS